MSEELIKEASKLIDFRTRIKEISCSLLHEEYKKDCRRTQELRVRYYLKEAEESLISMQKHIDALLLEIRKHELYNDKEKRND